MQLEDKTKSNPKTLEDFGPIYKDENILRKKYYFKTLKNIYEHIF
jgi:hypothetical protein